jgi:hypothetical protein
MFRSWLGQAAPLAGAGGGSGSAPARWARAAGEGPPAGRCARAGRLPAARATARGSPRSPRSAACLPQVGSIFGVWPGSKILGLKGSQQAAAAYSVYGPRTLLVWAVPSPGACTPPAAEWVRPALLGWAAPARSATPLAPGSSSCAAPGRRAAPRLQPRAGPGRPGARAPPRQGCAGLACGPPGLPPSNKNINPRTHRR